MRLDAPSMTEVLLEFAGRLPNMDREENLERLEWCKEHGNLIILNEFGNAKGYAELYKLKNPPQYPVWPYPVNEKDGEFLYCYAAVCDKGFIQKLMRLAKYRFPECKYLCWHRHKKNNRLKVVEMENV